MGVRFLGAISALLCEYRAIINQKSERIALAFLINDSSAADRYRGRSAYFCRSARTRLKVEALSLMDEIYRIWSEVKADSPVIGWNDLLCAVTIGQPPFCRLGIQVYSRPWWRPEHI